MAARISLKTLNAELARRGIQTLLAKGSGYFYFHTGDAADWLDRTVPVAMINALTLEQWIGEFQRLKKVNAEIMGARRRAVKPSPNRKRSRTAK